METRGVSIQPGFICRVRTDGRALRARKNTRVQVVLQRFVCLSINAVRRGEVQTISTDHCSFTLEQKDMGREDFTKIPGGLPGVETRGEVIYTIAENENKLSLAGVCRALSENPAKLYGLFPRKGVIAPGSDADIVVYAPGASHVLHGAELLSKAGYTPFEGFRTNGGVSKVYLRGELQVDGGKVVGGKRGEYLKRGKCAL